MRYVVLMLVLLAGCTESATQWQHQKDSVEACRADAPTEQDRTNCEAR